MRSELPCTPEMAAFSSSIEQAGQVNVHRDSVAEFENSQITLTVASSGIVSILIYHERTSHSRRHIPVDIQSESMRAVSAQSDLAIMKQTMGLRLYK